jgi:tripartite-type tricarboxylate transporter receptor subunit TctC
MRRYGLGILLLCAVSAFLSTVRAQGAFPAGTVRLVVPLAAGGPADAVARLFSKHASEEWKQPVIVENRPGAAGMIGSAAVAKAKPDGHTLLFGVPSLTVFKVLIKKPEVDTERDLAAISQILSAPYGIVVPSALPVKTLQEFVAYAKARPGQLNYGAIAGGQTLAVELFRRQAGLDLVRVPYAAAASMVALANNEIQLGFDSLYTLGPNLNAGKVRLLAVTSAQRAPAQPGVPAVMESGIRDYDVSFWFGIFAPAGTPDSVKLKIARLSAEFARRPDTVSVFDRFGYIPVGSTPEQFSRYISEEIRRWDEVSKYANVQPQ